MYLSLLEVDARSTMARTWIANPYRVHQRLLMAFPAQPPGRLLFRIEDKWTPLRLLVQSGIEADWSRAFAEHPVLCQLPLQKSFTPRYREGEVLRFLLRANPTKRLPSGRPGERVDGARVGLSREDDQRDWMLRKGAAAGFRPLDFRVRQVGTVRSHKTPSKDRGRQSHLVVEFEGMLEVADPDVLTKAVEHGIGTAKAYGNGLLSLGR